MVSADPRVAALRADAVALAAADVRLGRAAALAGDFPIVLRPPGFGTLLRIILEQQVSVGAARAMWERLAAQLDAVTPEAFLALDDETLRRCGFSRQKAGYGRALAATLAAGGLDLPAMEALDDVAVIERLCALKGIGRWSAECYLLWALGRPDVLPAQDMALQVGWQWLTDAPARPTPEQLRAVAEPWRPRRTAAAFLIWHAYLAVLAARRGRRGPPPDQETGGTAPNR